jgi:hypothetical protein
MKELGIFVLRIKNDQILYSFDSTIELIETNLTICTVLITSFRNPGGVVLGLAK